jgi:hypothetical protein
MSVDSSRVSGSPRDLSAHCRPEGGTRTSGNVIQFQRGCQALRSFPFPPASPRLSNIENRCTSPPIPGKPGAGIRSKMSRRTCPSLWIVNPTDCCPWSGACSTTGCCPPQASEPVPYDRRHRDRVGISGFGNIIHARTNFSRS